MLQRCFEGYRQEFSRFTLFFVANKMFFCFFSTKALGKFWVKCCSTQTHTYKTKTKPNPKKTKKQNKTV